MCGIWLAVICAYVGLSKVCLLLGAVGGSASPFWLPSGLIFGLPFLLGYRIMPGIFLGQFLSAWLFEDGAWWGAALEGVGNVLEGGIFRYFALRFGVPRDPLSTPQHFAAIFPGLLMGSAVNATFGVGQLFASGVVPAGQLLRTAVIWSVGDIGGALIILPLLLSWWNPDWSFWVRRKRGEFFALALILSGLTWCVFFDVVELPIYSLSFALLPLLLVGAFRFNPAGVSLLNAMMMAMAIFGTVRGSGPFKSFSPIVSIALLQSFTTVLIITTLLLLVINRQRQSVMAQLQSNAVDLESQVHDRTVALENALTAVEQTSELKRAIVRCNEAMMRIRDEQVLMNEICRIAVEDGHLQLAWIGVVDLDTQRLIPVAKYGKGLDYVDQIQISIAADVPEGQGPGGTAARERRAVVNNDYAHSPLMVPWREQAARYGWGASAGFPIMRNGRCYGVFSVYHSEANAFDDEKVGLLTEMCNDISFALELFDTERARLAAEEKNLLAAHVFDDAHEGVFITDSNGLIVDANPAFSHITGYPKVELIGKSVALLRSDRAVQDFGPGFWNALLHERRWRGEFWGQTKDGTLYAALMTFSTLSDDSGHVMHFVGLITDITQIREQQERLELMAHYDVLTKLPNRHLFAERLTQAINRAERDEMLFAVCFLDLDGFKEINDSLGHQAGDSLLVEIANRIRRSLREEDTLARFGGDEFSILLCDLQSVEQCEIVLKRIHEALSIPFSLDGRNVTLGASTGVTFYPDDESSPDTLLRHADQAMYQAKLLGRNRYHFFDLAQDQKIQSRRQELGAIEAAFGKKQFVLFYQPKVNMRTGRVIGLEALIRWIHPERGIVPPIAFLPLITGSSFEITLGYWVIEEALSQIDKWRLDGLDIDVSVNISAAHLQHQDFQAELRDACARHPQLRPLQVELEVLESSVLDDVLHVSKMIKTCRENMGVKFSLDDFGTGYSSLTHMRHLSVDTIKIDQSFVRHMIDNPDDLTIVKGILGLAGAFHRDVIAEGVETLEHGKVLLGLDCYLAQGYAIAKPMPAGEVPSWVVRYNNSTGWCTE